MLWLELTSYDKKILVNMTTVANIEPYEDFTILKFATASGQGIHQVQVTESTAQIERLLNRGNALVSR
ncbi:hypothetical protein [Methylobacterium iners]|uniref:Uncharacterized protein n=1 Tax=Methylobacterium iners TaxID=418707 RepID=A0ABQ4RQ68_9HYPH|nr:hypothetical protein [Methylobacterium iners]GJD92903.1 hypothetical protein OCOJLMKI_0086 [Methylobacterium iners]